MNGIIKIDYERVYLTKKTDSCSITEFKKKINNNHAADKSVNQSIEYR